MFQKSNLKKVKVQAGRFNFWQQMHNEGEAKNNVADLENRSAK